MPKKENKTQIHKKKLIIEKIIPGKEFKYIERIDFSGVLS